MAAGRRSAGTRGSGSGGRGLVWNLAFACHGFKKGGVYVCVWEGGGRRTAGNDEHGIGELDDREVAEVL